MMKDLTNTTGTMEKDQPQSNNVESHDDDDTLPATSVEDTKFEMNNADISPLEASEDLEEPEGFQSKFWNQINNVTADWIKLANDNKILLQRIAVATLLVLYAAYLIYTSVRDLQEAVVMLVFSALCFVTFTYVIIRNNFGKRIWLACLKPSWKFVQVIWKYLKWILLLIIIIGIAVWLYFLIRCSPKQLTSAFGLLVFIFFTYIFSKNPRKVKWRPVVWGIVLMFLLGVFILETDFGCRISQWIANIVTDFLEFSDAGAIFVFGEAYTVHPFAFKVLPVLIYFSAVISILYHLGIMQILIRKLAWLMRNTMQTSASESLNAVANIFIGQAEAPLLIRPILKDMTESELHAVMTCGFATVAGSVLGAYMTFGVSPAHILAASVMSAPAALAISKLFYPETKETSDKTVDQVELTKSEHRNMIEAASDGAYTAVTQAVNIAGNLIAYLSLLAFFNGLLGYFGGLIGVPQLSFEWICSYLFIPVAFLMGVDSKDCGEVARLVGLKIVVNEFYAYEELSTLIENRVNSTEPSLSIRSEIIATFALCGFANIGSIGIQLGVLTFMAPSRRTDFSKLAIRALIAGVIASFLTASVAGVLYYDGDGNGDGNTVLTNDNLCNRITFFTNPKYAESIPFKNFSTVPTPNISTSQTHTFNFDRTVTFNLSRTRNFTLTTTKASLLDTWSSTTFYLLATSEKTFPPDHQPHHPPVDHHNQSPVTTPSPHHHIPNDDTSDSHHPPAHQPHHPPVDHHNQSPVTTPSPHHHIPNDETSDSQHLPVHQPHHPPVDHHNQSPVTTPSPHHHIPNDETSDSQHPPVHQPHHPPVDHHNQSPVTTSSPHHHIPNDETSDSQHSPVHQPHHPPVDHHNQSPVTTSSPHHHIPNDETSDSQHPPVHQPHHPAVDHHNQSPVTTPSPHHHIPNDETSDSQHSPAHQPHHPPAHNPNH